MRQIRNDLGSQYPESDVAARAAFERDKAELRDMGIPIEMITLGGDRAGEGAYTVDRRSYELSDLGLTDAELEALKLAAATVRIGAAHGEAALWKLGGERALEQPLTSVNIELDSELMPVLADALAERRERRERHHSVGTGGGDARADDRVLAVYVGKAAAGRYGRRYYGAVSSQPRSRGTRRPNHDPNCIDVCARLQASRD